MAWELDGCNKLNGLIELLALNMLTGLQIETRQRPQSALSAELNLNMKITRIMKWTTWDHKIIPFHRLHYWFRISIIISPILMHSSFNVDDENILRIKKVTLQSNFDGLTIVSSGLEGQVNLVVGRVGEAMEAREVDIKMSQSSVFDNQQSLPVLD